MWFEILPSFAIIVAAVAAPHGVAYVLNYLVLGNFYRRLLDTDKLKLQYLHDRRLTYNPYIVNGLECIPDDDDDDETEGGDNGEQSKQGSRGGKGGREGDDDAEGAGLPGATEKAEGLEDGTVSDKGKETQGGKCKC